MVSGDVTGMRRRASPSAQRTRGDGSLTSRPARRQNSASEPATAAIRIASCRRSAEASATSFSSRDTEAAPSPSRAQRAPTRPPAGAAGSAAMRSSSGISVRASRSMISCQARSASRAFAAPRCRGRFSVATAAIATGSRTGCDACLIRQIRPRMRSRSGWVRGTSLWEMTLLYQSTTYRQPSGPN